MSGYRDDRQFFAWAKVKLTTEVVPMTAVERARYLRTSRLGRSIR